ncbi:MAG: hypothetical protein ACI8Z1_002643 [Candidatus Azotimanducaceae bacterium]|jgi:hypothetical protein
MPPTDMLLKVSGTVVQINAIPDAMRAFSDGVSARNDSIDEPMDEPTDRESIMNNMVTPDGVFHPYSKREECHTQRAKCRSAHGLI